MNSQEIDYLRRRQVVLDSMRACDSAEAEGAMLNLLGSRAEDWSAEDIGWLSWLRSRPASRLVLGQAGGGSCFVYSPVDRCGYWAVTNNGVRGGQGILSTADITALDAIASQKGLK